MSKRYAALENLKDCEDINTAWENNDNIKTSARECLGLAQNYITTIITVHILFIIVRF
jgi:hypothetical protein